VNKQSSSNIQSAGGTPSAFTVPMHDMMMGPWMLIALIAIVALVLAGVAIGRGKSR
jgi:hypothetical protein